MKNSARKRLAVAAAWVLLTSTMFASVAAAISDVRFTPADEQGRYNYLITFAEPGMLAEQRQRAPGQRFNAGDPATVAHRDQLRATQADSIQDISRTLGRQLEISHYFFVFESAIGARLTDREAKQVSELPGVSSVERERLYELDTFRGPTFIGADGIWDGTSVPGGMGHEGEGLVAAILDTGVDPGHPSFANDPACDHGGANPAKLISFLDCATTDTGNIGGLCNGPSPVDTNGHGSHTASTVAGNALDSGATPPPVLPISGVAPCASVRSYKVCPTNCPGFNIQAGMSSILIHGDVDIMNFSISGGQNPWTDNDRRKLDLVDEGILVAASAGNTSAGQPNPVGQVNHRGPWVFTVAASTRDGEFPGILSASGPGAPPGDTQNIQATKGSGSPGATPLVDHPIRHFSDQDPGEEGCDSSVPQFPADFFDGAVALIHRGICPFTEKITNAFNAGADMVIIRNNQGGALNMATPGQPAIPAYSIDQVPGDALVAFVGANPTTATVDFELPPDPGDVLAGFSFRGPTPSPLHDLQKPDITAPGVNIYAAVPVGLGGYGNISGTSMSSPHTAGAGLLVKAVQPTWTVPEIKSAIMMTAYTGGTKENGTTPWDADDVGSGRVDLTKAALAGLVMHETTTNFLAANPSGGSINVKDLNLPAVRNMDCTPSCTWTRTVRNTLSVPTSWSAAGTSITPGFDIEVSPANFSFTGSTSETQVLTITATPMTDLSAAVAFGEVVLTEDGDESPAQHITVAIRGIGAEPPTIELDPDSFDFLVELDGGDTQALTISNLGDEDLIWSIDEAEPAGAGRGGDIVVFNNVNFTPPADFDGGSVRWATGETCDCFQSGAGWNFNPYQTSGNLAFFWYTDLGDRGGVSMDGGTTVAVLQHGDTVGAGNNYNFTTGTAPAANWRDAGGVEGYMGFRFENPLQGGAVNYGYAHIITDGATGHPMTIVGWAYNQAGDPITVAPLGGGGACDNPTDISWLSVDPDSGTTEGQDSSDVDVTVDATGLAEGDYEALLCVNSNDPANPVVEVPVNLTVVEIISDPPTIQVDPDSFDVNLFPGQSTDEMLEIHNLGDQTLDWTIHEAEPAGTGYAPRGSGGFHAPVGYDRASGPAPAGESGAHTVPAVPQGGPVIGDWAEGFEDITQLPGAGWHLQNNSQPLGTTGWLQGGTPFDAHQGPPNSYIAANFNNASGVGDISNWLLTPEIELHNGTELRFWTRTTPQFQNFNDRLEVRLSTAGASTDVGTTASSVGDFTELLLTINENLLPGVYPEVWTEFVVEVDGLPASTSGRLAFRYWVTNSGPAGAFGDFIGIDTVSVTQPEVDPEGCDLPASVPWLSVSPDAGSTPGGESDEVDVSFDATGLAPGEYEALLCVDSNDPVNPRVEVPVLLTVLVQPPGELEVNPDALDFGEVQAGDDEVMFFDVTNAADAGALPVTLTAITAAGDGEFSVTGGDCTVGTMLEPGDSCNVEVTFSPGAAGDYNGSVTVESSDQSAVVTLTGAGLLDPGELELSPAELDFGEVGISTTATEILTLTNTAAPGSSAVQVVGILFLGDGEFADTGNGTCEVGSSELEPGDSCTIEVSFTPSAEGDFAGSVVVDGAGGKKASASLSGSGVELPDGVFSDRFEEQ